MTFLHCDGGVHVCRTSPKELPVPHPVVNAPPLYPDVPRYSYEGTTRKSPLCTHTVAQIPGTTLRQGSVHGSLLTP